MEEAKVAETPKGKLQKKEKKAENKMPSLDDVISAEFTSKPKVAKVVMEIPKNRKNMVLKKKEGSHQGFKELLNALNYEVRT